jgi:3-oxoacyl-[acyl-carrier protein] reductase
MGRLTGKVALVTGGSRGIGAGIVKKLVQEGASVVFTYVNAAEKANMLQRELSVQEGNILSIKADSSETKMSSKQFSSSLKNLAGSISW